MKDIFLKLMFIILKTTSTTNESHFLPARIKTEKVKKLAATLHDNTEYLIHLRNLKQALDNELVLKKSLCGD